MRVAKCMVPSKNNNNANRNEFWRVTLPFRAWKAVENFDLAILTVSLHVSTFFVQTTITEQATRSFGRNWKYAKSQLCSSWLIALVLRSFCAKVQLVSAVLENQEMPRNHRSHFQNICNFLGNISECTSRLSWEGKEHLLCLVIFCDESVFPLCNISSFFLPGLFDQSRPSANCFHSSV